MALGEGKSDAKEEKPKKAGKKLGEAACKCGAKLIFYEGVAKLEFNKKDVTTLPVDDNSSIGVAGIKIDYMTEQEVTCLCGEKQKVGPLKK